MLLKLE